MKYPIAVGGVGGSGTRLFGEILRGLGYFIGDDLNSASDNLLYTFLFKRPDLLTPSGRRDEEIESLFSIFSNYMEGSRRFSAEAHEMVEACVRIPRLFLPKDWLKERFIKFTKNCPLPLERQKGQPWAWKEPNTHLFVDIFLRKNPKLIYFHIIRNGLDMAFSSNQNQVAIWGDALLGKEIGKITPAISLEYWVKVHRRIFDIEKYFTERIFLINFDRFCQNPGKGIRFLSKILRKSIDEKRVDSLISLVRVPSSIGRFKEHDLSQFKKDHILFVSQLGFDVSPLVCQDELRRQKLELHE